MYKLNVTPIDDKFDLHTMSVPVDDVNAITDKRSKAYKKLIKDFRVARHNKINFNTGVQALGPNKGVAALSPQKFASRSLAEEKLKINFFGEDDFILLIEITNESSSPYILFASRVYNPQRIFKNRCDVRMPFTAKLTFDDTDCSGRAVSSKGDVKVILPLLKISENTDFDQNVKIRMDDNDPEIYFHIETDKENPCYDSLFAMMFEIISTAQAKFKATPYQGVIPNVIYV